MPVNHICDRCNSKDTDNFGTFQICPITNRHIYTCFECTDLCDYCKQVPSVILKNNRPARYACMTCYNKY